MTVMALASGQLAVHSAIAAVDRFGPTRVLRLLFLKDRRALGESVARLLEWDFDRAIMSHGHIVESGGKGLLTQAFAWLPGSLSD